ncbi:MAG: hypothetical protein AAF211_33430, partial [Myxococcota bacterium]
LRNVDDTWWLVWAHTRGTADETGPVGLATTPEPTEPPTYVADLVPGDGIGPFGFLRGVELVDGRLVLTDSRGPDGGRVLEAAFWTPSAVGGTGALGDQRFVDLGEAEVWQDGLDLPYEAWFWSDG